MIASQSVHCPICGSTAQRFWSPQTIRTECAACDYLLVLCALTGNVMESYAPGLSVERFQTAIQPNQRSLESQPTLAGGGHRTEPLSKPLGMAIAVSSR